MPELKFRVQQRFKEFEQRIRKNQLFSSQFYLYLGGWFFLLFAVVSVLDSINFTIIPLIAILLYFWHKIINKVYYLYKPPAEVTIFIALFFVFLGNLWIKTAIPAEALQGVVQYDPSFFVLLPQILLMGFAILFISLLLVENNDGRHGVIYTYIFLGILSVLLKNAPSEIYWIIYMVILTVFLFRRSRWLEELTKSELWIYFFFFVTMFLNFNTVVPFNYTEQLPYQNYSFYYIPRFLFILMKLYLLATLIRIPFVMVYNHASLARKLKIAGLFQSNIPQIFQLVLLLVFFYFFIAGWQASNLQESIENKIFDLNITSQKEQQVTIAKTQNYLKLPNYHKVTWENEVPYQGIMELIPETSTVDDSASAEIFAFLKETEGDSIQFYFSPLEGDFMRELSARTAVLASSQLSAYPFKISGWDSLFYEIQIFGINSSKMPFRIFPFAFYPYHENENLNVPMGKQPTFNDSSNIKIKIFNRNVFTLGRVYTPLYNSEFNQVSYLAFDINLVADIEMLTSSIARQILLWLVIYILINALLIRQVVRFGEQIHEIIIRKFDQLKNGIREISTGNLDYKIHLEGEDEFVELGNRFNQMSNRLKRTINEVREKERLEYELKIAREVQLSLLPHALPEIPDFELAATIKTATEVGGDFYDAIKIDDHQFLLIIGDISGKGTSAAFYMAQCISLIRFACQFTSDPKDILLRINRYFSGNEMDREIFVTAIVGLLDTQKNSIQIYRAGHNRPYLIPGEKSKGLSEIESNGMGIGLDRKGLIFENSLKVQKINLSHNDTIVFYTDGLIEAAHSKTNDKTDGDTEFYGESRFKILLSENRGLSAQALVDKITEDLQNFYKSTSYVDDSTILILKKDGNS